MARPWHAQATFAPQDGHAHFGWHMLVIFMVCRSTTLPDVVMHQPFDQLDHRRGLQATQMYTMFTFDFAPPSGVIQSDPVWSK